MRMDKVAGSGYDEFYTPEYAIEPLLPYLKPRSTIWCPFDTVESNYVKVLVREGHTVVFSHLKYGQDFFEVEVPKCDYIISNPPYSIKGEVFERLFKLGIPFAMLVGVIGLFESKKRFSMFAENNFEIMYFDKRVAFFTDYNDPKPKANPPFSTGYICKDILPERIVFSRIKKGNK